MLKEKIDIGEFETYKLLGLLRDAKKRSASLPYILMQFYDLYCDGYAFLRDLGLGYGLYVQVPPNADSWEDLNTVQQTNLLEGFYPGLDEEIDRVTLWLVAGKVILTGEQDEIEHYQYSDFRTDDEKNPQIWVSVSESKHEKNANTSQPKQGKMWWKFW